MKREEEKKEKRDGGQLQGGTFIAERRDTAAAGDRSLPRYDLFCLLGNLYIYSYGVPVGCRESKELKI